LKNLLAIAIVVFPMLGMAQNLKLDTKNASVSFVFESEGVKGTVGGVEATLELNLSDLGSSVIKGSAKTATLSTNSRVRDKHLQSGDFFDAENYPEMKFTSASVTKKGEEYFAKGSLTIKDVTKEVTFKMVMKDEVLTMTTAINAADYGVSPKKEEKSDVTVTVSVPFAKS